ncbi:sigma-70 family RNA polymerase sigma factor [Isosphaeraceae bacterium EP7]
MRTGWSRSLTRDVGRLAGAGTLAGLTEGEVLHEFARHRDEVAFESLMLRHGPMVLGVCRRWLRDPNDVDDAFQATFLVLARRARSIRPGAALGPWLHGVARRIAARARSEADRRPHPGPGATAELADPRPSPGPELRWALDDELGRLPEKYRAPLVLCYLEGRTHEEAAAALRWPVGTVRGRLSRGRDALRDRLTRRGIVPDAGLGVALTVEPAEVARILSAMSPVPAALIESTRHAALGAAAGQLAGRLALSARVVTLSEGATKAMTLIPLKAAAGFLSVGLVAVGATAMAARGYGPGSGVSSEPIKYPLIRLAVADAPSLPNQNDGNSPPILASNEPPPASSNQPPAMPEEIAHSPFEMDRALPGSPPNGLAPPSPNPESPLPSPSSIDGVPVLPPMPSSDQPFDVADGRVPPILDHNTERPLPAPEPSTEQPPLVLPEKPTPEEKVLSPRRPGESVAKYLERVGAEIDAMVKELTDERNTMRARLHQIDSDLERLAGFQNAMGIGPGNLGVGRARRSAMRKADPATETELEDPVPGGFEPANPAEDVPPSEARAPRRRPTIPVEGAELIPAKTEPIPPDADPAGGVTVNRTPTRPVANVDFKVAGENKILDMGEEMNFIVRIRNQSEVDAHKIRVQAIVSENLKVVNVTPFSRDVQQRPFATNDIRTVINFPLIEQLSASTASSLMSVMVIRVKAVKPGGRASCRVQITHRDLDGDYLERSASVQISPNDARGTDPGGLEELPAGVEPAPSSRPSPTPTPSVPAVAPIASEPTVPPVSEARPTESSPIDPPATQPADAPATPTPGNEPTPTPKIPSEAVQLESRLL